jgi:hypothetical protein
MIIADITVREKTKTKAMSTTMRTGMRKEKREERKRIKCSRRHWHRISSMLSQRGAEMPVRAGSESPL